MAEEAAHRGGRVSQDNTFRDRTLSSSIASRVSWGQRLKEGQELEERGSENNLRGVSASSKISHRSGRRTPLMYRAERTLQMMEGKEQTTSEGPEQTESSGSKEDSGSDDEASPEQTTDTLGDRIGDSNKPAESAPLSDVSALLDNVSLRPPAIVRSSKSLSDLTAGLFTAPVDTLIADGQSSVGDGPRLSADQSKPYDGVGILRAFSYHLTTDEWLWEKVYTQQVAINNRNHAWDDVAALDDPYVLSALMWSWLEHLEQPAIGEGDVKKIVNGFQSEARQELESKEAVTGQFEKALASLDERGKSCSFRRIADCIVSFSPMTADLLEAAARRALIALTHASIDEKQQLVPECNQQLEEAFLLYLRSKAVVIGNKKRPDLRGPLPPESGVNELSGEAKLEMRQSGSSNQTSEGRTSGREQPRSSGQITVRKSTDSARSTSSSSGNVAIPSIVVS